MSEKYNKLRGSQKYGVTVAVMDEEMAEPIVKSLFPVVPKVLIGRGYPSFSKLVNTVINETEEEYVIFCSHRVRPTPKDINRMVDLLEKGYGCVGLYRLAFFGFSKELIRRIGFFDERFIGGWFEDNDFVLRLREADIAYYESESVEYHPGLSTWDHTGTLEIFQSKWSISNTKISRKLADQNYPEYDLGTHEEFLTIPTDLLFLPWSRTDTSTTVQSLVNLYVKHTLYTEELNIEESSDDSSDVDLIASVVTKNNELDLLCVTQPTIIPIHLRNIPPPTETFKHIMFLETMASWIKPNLYVEFGVRSGICINTIAPYCKVAHGIDICQVTQDVMNKHENTLFHKMTTDKYIETVLNKRKCVVDMVFIDANHESDQVMKDFEGVFSHVIEDGFIFLHDTYPYDKHMTSPSFCDDSYKVPNMIKEKYSELCELVTLPFNPGLTIIKKKVHPYPMFLHDYSDRSL